MGPRMGLGASSPEPTNQGWASSQLWATTANPRVVTAKSSPGRRNDGMPTSMDARAPTAPAPTTANQNGTPTDTDSWYETAAPKPNNATCPSDTCPATPTTRVTEMASMA